MRPAVRLSHTIRAAESVESLQGAVLSILERFRTAVSNVMRNLRISVVVTMPRSSVSSSTGTRSM